MELTKTLRQTVVVTIIIFIPMLAAVVINFARPVAAGLLLGTLVSLVNSITGAKRVQRLPGMNPYQGIAYIRRGFSARFALIAAVLFLASKLPQISFLSVAAGLFIVQGIAGLIVLRDCLKHQFNFLEKGVK